MNDLNSILNSDDVLALTSASVDQTQVDVNGRTPLHRAVAAGATDCALWLIDQSKDAINVADNQGETPLMRAAWLGNATLVEALIARGADLNAQSLTGGSALHHAHSGTHAHPKGSGQQVIQQLVEAGADTELLDNAGKRPQDWASYGQAIAEGNKFLNPPKPRTLSLKRR